MSHVSSAPSAPLSPELEALTTRTLPDDWSDLDTRAVDTATVLAVEAVENAGSGHPGTPMSLAPVAYTLYQRQMRHDPNDPTWIGRDRFVLSAGHASLLQYIQLYMGGFGLELEDIKALRTWGALTPGHPEYGHTPGVEITTGPLGSGLATAVGMAMAARFERGLFDPDAAAGTSPFDHYTWVIAGDGDLQEGISAEACSLAGTQQLGNLIVLWDDNRISIEDDTQIAFTEDVAARYRSYGWQTLSVKGAWNITDLEKAIAEAKAETGKPTLIQVSTIIAYPAPTKSNSGASHGSALGADEVAGTKKALGFDPDKFFDVADEVIAHTRQLQERGKAAHDEWQQDFDRWASANPDKKALLDRLLARELPEGWDTELPTYEPDAKGVATRKASEGAIQALAATLPELWGGSADLAGSNNTVIKGADSFGPTAITTSTWTAQPYGRNLHFGIRENGMGAILNGIALHGNTRSYGGTFLIFSDYMRPPVRLAALQKLDTTYVWTHDSIGLGEDGPTHQPVEQLASLRAMPGISVIRPADANETSAAWRAMMLREPEPKAIVLTRQNVPVLEGTKDKATEGVIRGGYILVEASTGTPDVIIIATGSEVQLAVAAAAELEAAGTATRVVSMPCVEWFLEQDQAYQDEVLPPRVIARVSVEAGVAMPWYRFIGSFGQAVSLEHFGASAPAAELFERFGITTEAVVAAAEKSVTAVKHHTHAA